MADSECAHVALTRDAGTGPVATKRATTKHERTEHASKKLKVGKHADTIRKDQHNNNEDSNVLRFYSGHRCKVKYNKKVTPRLTKDQVNAHEAFSNFWGGGKDLLWVDGKPYRTSEHAFQALRFLRGHPNETPEIVAQRRAFAEHIAQAPSPSVAFMLSRFVMFRKKDGAPYVRLPFPSQCFKKAQQTILDAYRAGLRRFPPDHEADKAIMLRCLRAKFGQNEELRRRLLETHPKRLVEHTTRDGLWGDNGDGTGANQLGECLMRVRDELRGAHAAEHAAESTAAAPPTVASQPPSE